MKVSKYFTECLKNNVLGSQMSNAVNALLNHQMHDIKSYDELTIEEKELITRDLFNAMFVQNKSEKEIVIEKILNLKPSKITSFMRVLGIWDDITLVDAYDKDIIGEWVVDMNQEGYDVKVDIAVGRDYYIFGKLDKDGHTYCITGLLDSNEEFMKLLGLEKLVDDIFDDVLFNSRGKFEILNYLDTLVG